MKVGIPNGLLSYKYFPFFQTFFKELGTEVVTSPKTNKEILDLGVKHCVDEACVPVKVFHGHVASIKDKCDIILIPRIMQLRKREYICPKFCGLPEMVFNSIPNMPRIIGEPIYASTPRELGIWAKRVGSMFTSDYLKIQRAYKLAREVQVNYYTGINDDGFNINVALVGHPYNLYDEFLNMNLVKKLNALGVGVVTEEHTDEQDIDKKVNELFKKPFWTFARNSYGFSTHLAESRKVDGIVYISSFACGIDSIVVELIKDKLSDFPILILKIDEQTGEAGFNTRIEAFTDMLTMRKECSFA
ncbi:MAG: acyl-CoA dehydratase activase-related protein [Bacillota bacterium]|nr:acyl-CoA dehydratase activase-related protein [Bacillota bacterium]